MLVLSLLLSVVLRQGLLIETKSLLPEAVAHAIGNSFNQSADLLHIVIETDSDENKSSFLDTVQLIILENTWTFRLQIDVNNELGKAVSDHNLWFIDSYKAFRRLLEWIRDYHRDSQLFNFIVLRTSDSEKKDPLIQQIFSDFLKLMFGNLNLIVEGNSGEILFYTFYPYHQLACHSTEPFLIFRYDNNTLTPQQGVFPWFPSKADNFHGCPLRMKTRNELILTLGNSDIPNKLKNYEMSLLELVIFKELSSIMNFTFDIHFATDSGPYDSLKSGKFDVAVGSFANGPTENHAHSVSVVYFLSWLVIALQRRPDALRTLVWLLVPFNSSTWACTLGFLVLSTGCVVLVRKTKKLAGILNVRNLGGLEILSMTIGGSVEQLPRRNSLRFAFIVLSLAALVLRSAYLGKLFDAYRGFTMTKPPRSVLELLAENYTIFAHNIFKPIIDDLIGLENVHFKALDPYKSSFSILSDTDNRNAFVVSFIFIYTFQTAEERKHLILKSVLRHQICMFFQQHSIIAPRVNEIIMGMEEAGILHYVRRNYDDLDRSTQSLQEKMLKPIPLVLERFAFTFYLFGVLNAIGILIFVVEVLWKKFKKQ